ncbi:hypothetical protein [Deinococcus altitudinis]|uniref:hypothetical protein n=1 Tax=Deinococcus altitudinis TaxID=468914 RepID=UPI0038928E63
MTLGLRLNTTAVHTWAAVVSGTAWKRHTLESGGELTAEYARGPLILWAIRPGEGEGLQADGPAVSALEDRIETLNTAQVFERFKWAAKGKVRPSVRWKTGRKPRRLRKLEVLADVAHVALITAWKVSGRRGVVEYIPAKTAKARREDRKFWEAVRFGERLEDIAPRDEDDAEAVDNWDEMYLQILDVARRAPDLHIELENNRVWRRGLLPDLLSYALILKDNKTIQAIIRLVKKRVRLEASDDKARVLEFLQIYRAHLARRVKPAPRRHRIRRPLHSRPRPPSAPLAPPVI